MADFVLQSKLVGEKIEVFFDFLDELDWGETISSAVCSVEVLSGEDTSPGLMLTGLLRRFETSVSQQFYQGLPGVIYFLICDATGSTGNKYRKITKLAVLPDNAFNPPLVENIVTTPPYPVDITEQIRFSAAPLEGRLKYQPFPLDSIAASVTPQAGDLYGSGTSFSTPVESIEATVTPQAGQLYGAAKAFAAPPEAVRASVSPYSADLFGAGLTYSITPQEIKFTVTPLSGSLT